MQSGDAMYGQPELPPGPPQDGAPFHMAAPSPHAQTAQALAQTPSWGQQQQPLLPMPATDQSVNGAHVAIAWVCAVMTLGYLLPWAIGATRGKSNAGAVGLVNFFAGWTVVGWIVALVMACGAHQQRYSPQVTTVHVAQQHYPQAQVANTMVGGTPPAAWYPAPDGAGQAYWDGRQWTGHRA